MGQIIRGLSGHSDSNDEFSGIPTPSAHAKDTMLPRLVVGMSHSQSTNPHHISICVSPVCSVMGQDRILERLEEELKTCCGNLSADGLFFLEKKGCPGFCEMAPVIHIDGIPYEDIQPEDIPVFLNSFRLLKV